MEIIGKLLMKLPLQSGIGRTGNSWQKQEFVIETIEQYPKKVCANLWGDKLDMLDTVNIGDTVKVSFSIESREFNGKWYTDVRVWRFDPVGAVPAPAAAPAQPVQQPVMHQTPPPTATTPEYYAPADDSTDDLPF